MTFPRIWIAWLLALVFGFAAPAQAMRGLTGLGTPLGAKSHCVNNPINYNDPDGLEPAGNQTVPGEEGGTYWDVFKQNRHPDAANVGRTNVGASSTIQTLTDIFSFMIPVPKQNWVVSNAGRTNKCAKGVKVTKAVNSEMAHAVDQAVKRGVFASPKQAQDAIRAVSAGINAAGALPAGSVWDSSRVNRVLVPLGETGYAVYSLAKNGAAKLETTLIRGIYGK